MDHVRKAAVSTKKFVERHRVAVAVSITTTMCVMMHVTVVDDINDFLKKHDLFDTYYNDTFIYNAE